MEDVIMNSHETPELLEVKTRCDHTLFWTVVRYSLWIGIVLFALDVVLSSNLHWTKTVGGNQPGDVLDAIRSFSWDRLRDAIKSLRG